MMRRFCFNMIEVTMALLVIAIGVTAIFGLIPISAKSHRNAIYRNYSADAAQDMLHWLSEKLRADWVNERDNYGATPPNVSVLADFPKSVYDTTKWDDMENTTLFPVRRDRHANWYKSKSSGAVYRIYIDSDIRKGDGNDRTVTDFDAMVRIWRSPTTAFEYDTSVSNFVSKTDSTFDKRIQLNIEVSWPATSDYSDREKALYSMEVVRSGQ